METSINSLSRASLRRGGLAVLIIAAAASAMGCDAALADAKDELLALCQANEANRPASYRVVYKLTKTTTYDHQTRAKRATPLSAVSVCAVTADRGRWRVEEELREASDQSEVLVSRRISAYDGEEFSSWDQANPRNENPVMDVGHVGKRDVSVLNHAEGLRGWYQSSRPERVVQAESVAYVNDTHGGAIGFKLKVAGSPTQYFFDSAGRLSGVDSYFHDVKAFSMEVSYEPLQQGPPSRIVERYLGSDGTLTSELVMETLSYSSPFVPPHDWFRVVPKDGTYVFSLDDPEAAGVVRDGVIEPVVGGRHAVEMKLRAGELPGPFSHVWAWGGAAMAAIAILAASVALLLRRKRPSSIIL